MGTLATFGAGINRPYSMTQIPAKIYILLVPKLIGGANALFRRSQRRSAIPTNPYAVSIKVAQPRHLLRFSQTQEKHIPRGG